MAATRYSNDLRRQVGSPRSKGREHKDTLCRNILIYGHCRYEDQGCAFNHDQNKSASSTPPDFTSKKTFNVESPSFTPMAQQPAGKKSTLSHAANAAPFTPRGAVSAPAIQPQSAEPSMFNPAGIREFTPQTQSFDLGNTTSSNNAAQESSLYSDPFTTMGQMGAALPPGQFNPYASDHSALTAQGGSFYPQHGAFSVGPILPPNYHLYQPSDPYRGDLQPWERFTYDFFLPRDLREHSQKKMFAVQQVLPNSNLPTLEHYHSLFPLDTTNRKNSSIFGYASWVYKAFNSRNGKTYALRRLEGYTLTNEKAILEVMKRWKQIENANIVAVHEAFTTREFGDSSLIFAYDFHPLAKTLQEQFFPAPNPNGGRNKPPTPVAEAALWPLICQIANALTAIHSADLAARCIEPSKILLTDGNRIRLAACSVLEVVQFENNSQTTSDLQQEDLVKFGKLVLSLATATQFTHMSNIGATLGALTHSTKYSASFKDAVHWLVTPSDTGNKIIGNFIGGIAGHMTSLVNAVFSANDRLNYELEKELENGRLVRLSFKLHAISERGDLGATRDWSETGDRYQLKLFRDYVFHRVAADGNPDLSIGHMISCLNKLDVGSEEMVVLTSRDNVTIFVVSYKELRKMYDRSWNDLVKLSKGPTGSN